MLFWVNRLISVKEWPIVLAFHICLCKNSPVLHRSSSAVCYLALLIEQANFDFCWRLYMDFVGISFQKGNKKRV